MNPILFYWLTMFAVIWWGHSKNLSLILVFLVSVFLTPLGGAVFVLIFGSTENSKDSGRKPCENCAELIMVQAKVCRFCGLNFDKIAVNERGVR